MRFERRTWPPTSCTRFKINPSTSCRCSNRYYKPTLSAPRTDDTIHYKPCGHRACSSRKFVNDTLAIQHMRETQGTRGLYTDGIPRGHWRDIGGTPEKQQRDTCGASARHDGVCIYICNS
eukprot:1318333-Amorphochlora_amoeboformis.AAC.1